MQNPRRLYKELGNLFYAIAAADKRIRPEERKTLHDEILFAWKHHENSTDRFGSDRAFLIEFEFETMEEEAATSENAYNLFERYFKENEKEFDQSSRVKIFNSARHIAESVRKINHEELIYLVRLKELLKI
ncbi:MAG: hypothetical protein HYZ15_08360 [Sphingobacteriales bacterium]|nr:hypothetical protein [Sphingobacteriales bacterium]